MQYCIQYLIPYLPLRPFVKWSNALKLFRLPYLTISLIFFHRMNLVGLFLKQHACFFLHLIYFCFIIQLLNLLWNSGVIFSGDRFCPWVICFCCTIVSKTETFCKGHLAAVFDKLHNILLNPGQIYIKDIWYGIKIALSSL